jgi:hypothetical protein
MHPELMPARSDPPDLVGIQLAVDPFDEEGRAKSARVERI